MKKMEKGRIRNRHSITVDEEIWAGAGKVLASSGLSRSSFIESVFRAVWQSDNKSYKEVTGELFGGLVEMASINLDKKRRKKQK